MYEYYKGVFEEFGFDVSKKGFVLFADLVEDVKTLFKEGKTPEEVREQLPSYYLEQYHFVQEIGKNKYFDELKGFCNSRKALKRISEYDKIVGALPKTGLDDSVIYFASYFSSKEQKTDNASKVYVHLNKTAE